MTKGVLVNQKEYNNRHVYPYMYSAGISTLHLKLYFFYFLFKCILYNEYEVPLEFLPQVPLKNDD